MEYRVRSTYTRTRSAARRAADIAVILLVCLLLVFALFKFILVPVPADANVISDINRGELLLIDRVSKFISDYTPGDILRVDRGAGFELLRVAARGGSTYTVRDGCAYLDGALLDESEYSKGWPEGIDIELRIPENSLLLLPDVRDGITDPKGFITTYNKVFGEVRFRISPMKKLTFFI